jgi:hypothetical protein
MPSSPIHRRGFETKFFESFVSPVKSMRLAYSFLDERAGARQKAALARAHSKTCRRIGRAL